MAAKHILLEIHQYISFLIQSIAPPFFLWHNSNIYWMITLIVSFLTVKRKADLGVVKTSSREMGWEYTAVFQNFTSEAPKGQGILIYVRWQNVNFTIGNSLIHYRELWKVVTLVTDISLCDATTLFMFSQFQGGNRWLNTMKGIKTLQLFVNERFTSPGSQHWCTHWIS